MTPWLASHVRRWHANPALAHTQDPVAAHSARMGILALTIWPDASRALLVACLTHDLGEHATGDVPTTAKQDPQLRDALDRIEAQAIAAMGLQSDLTLTDQRRLRHLDRLDAYLWAEFHRPDLMARDDWRAARAWLDQDWMEVQG